MAIQLSDLTNVSTVRASGTQPVWEGTAIFDVLMKAVNENINIQYELTRITGSDYATVYLGAIETCIKEATNLLLQKAITDKEIEVKQAQILQIQAATLNTQEDTKLKSAQIKTEQEETKLKTAQAIAYPLQSAKDLEVKSKEIEVKTQQILTMQNDDNIKSAQSAKDLEVKTKDLVVKQAQIDKLNDDKLTSAKQRNLYQRQIEGFDDNKYQKLFESQLSSWGLMFSSGMLTEKPSIITGDKVSQLYTKLTTGI